MPFPQVKSDPWKKGLKRKRPPFQLWSGGFWKKLCERGAPLWSVLKSSQFHLMGKQGKRQELTPECIEMIHEMNELLYGREPQTGEPVTRTNGTMPGREVQLVTTKGEQDR